MPVHATDTLQFKMVDLARATGLATKPWADYDAGLIDINEAMARVINQSADAGPQFEALRQVVGTTNTVTDEATLRYLQLALAISKVAPPRPRPQPPRRGSRLPPGRSTTRLIRLCISRPRERSRS